VNKMRIERLPEKVLKECDTINKRLEAIQYNVNRWLSILKVCPIGEYTSGVRACRVQVAYYNGHYHLEQNFSNDNFDLKAIWRNVLKMFN